MADYRYPGGRLAVYTKAPVPGEVKTRLQPRLTPAQCASLYQRLTRHAAATAVHSRLYPVELHVAGDPDHPFLVELAGQFNLPVRLQQGDNLGERMHRTLSEALRSADFAMILGCDCPAVSPALLRQAGRALADKPVTLLPAEDGGYGLIGATVSDPAIFEAIDWGTGHVLAQTRRNLHRAGLGWTEPGTVWDVDRPQDLDRLLTLPGFADWTF